MTGELPGWTCPAFDKLIDIVSEHVPEPDRTNARIVIESLRVAHVQLRYAASRSTSERSLKRVEAEVARLEQRIASLTAKES